MENEQSCDKIKMLLSAYYDDELSQDDTEIVKAHIATCKDCLNDLDNIESVSSRLKNFGKNLLYPEKEIALTVVDRLNNEKELTCNEVLKEISAYYDGELSLKLHYLVDNHLKNCSSCQSEYENLVVVSKLLKSAYSNQASLCEENLNKM